MNEGQEETPAGAEWRSTGCVSAGGLIEEVEEPTGVCGIADETAAIGGSAMPDEQKKERKDYVVERVAVALWSC